MLIIEETDIHYTYDTKGYMLYYKNNPIGGAGIDRHAAGCKRNLKLFRDQAEMEKQMILRGHGQLRFYKAIQEIMEE